MKIAFVYSTLAKTGGTERILVEKANFFAEKFAFDVTIINCFQLQQEANFFPLSDKIKQINLGIPFFSQYKYKYPKRLWEKWQAHRMLKKSIKQAVRNVDPDILISVSRFKADIISAIKCRAKKIVECHEVKYNTIYDVGEKRSLPVRIMISIYEFIYFKSIERHADVIVTLTEKDKQLWNGAKHIEVIPDFSTMPVSRISDCSAKRVIAIGRLAWEKGFGRLIEAWTFVSHEHPDWQLDIYGEGGMHDTLRHLIRMYKARNVTIHRFTSDISHEYATSSLCVVTSYYEGFSLVLLEALRHGVPCVAFNCPFGPESIIDDARCGFLVPDGDIRLLSARICRLIEDDNLRKHFSKAAIEKASSFNVDIILNKHKELYEQLISNESRRKRK